MPRLIVPFTAELLANQDHNLPSTIGGNLGDLKDVSLHEIEPGLFEITGRLISSHNRLQEAWDNDDEFAEWAAVLIDDILFDYTHNMLDERLQVDWERDHTFHGVHYDVHESDP